MTVPYRPEHHLEVKIGDKWYVLSEKTVWHNIIHVVCDGAQMKYIFVPGGTNEVKEGAGGLVGFPADNPPWPEN